MGIHEYLRRLSGDRMAHQARAELSERLLRLYQANRREGWHWFEDIVAYSNAKLPHALLLSGHWMDNRPDMTTAGLEALTWLVKEQTAPEGHFMPIGNRGFYRDNGEKACFDQQPVEAYNMVSACLEAYRLTGDEQWYRQAQKAFDWFLGRNDLGLPLYDPSTGGCRDGLHPDSVNENQGVESTLAFLLSLTEMRLAQHLTNAN